MSKCSRKVRIRRTVNRDSSITTLGEKTPGSPSSALAVPKRWILDDGFLEEPVRRAEVVEVVDASFEDVCTEGTTYP